VKGGLMITRDIRNFVLIILFPCFIFGHKINIFATVEGNKIFTQSYASDGRKIKGGIIEVYDKSGNKLLSGVTDSLGEFSFVIPKKDDLKIVIIGGMGHRAETIVPAEDLPEIVSPKMERAQTSQNKESSKSPSRADIDTVVIRRLIEDAIDRRLHPVIKIIAEQKKEQIRFTDVVGGIGYIFGIVGICAYFMGKKRNA
jgi:nickel transport protein